MKYIYYLFLIFLISASFSCTSDQLPMKQDTIYPSPVKVSQAQMDSVSQNDVERDIRYREESDADPQFSLLDVYYKKTSGSAKQKPVIVFVHGGGWTKGDKSKIDDTEGGQIPEFFVDQGYILVSINFRLAPNVRLQDMAQDIAKALKWVSVNIRRYGGDGKNLTLWGYSSGAHLVSLVATDPAYLSRYNLSFSNLSGVIAMDVPQYDAPLALRRLAKEKMGDMNPSDRITYLKKLFGNSKDAQLSLSPVHFLKSGVTYPKFLLISSGIAIDRPQTVNRDMTENFNQQLIQHGVDSRHVHFSQMTHLTLFSNFFDGGVSDAIFEFLTDVYGKQNSTAAHPRSHAPHDSEKDIENSGLNPEIRNRIASRLTSFERGTSGKIYRDDVPPPGQKAFHRVDANQDGIIDPNELDRFRDSQ